MTSFLERVGVGIVLPLCLLMSFGCADYSPDIDDIHKRLDAMEDNQIATIESQIVSVNSSISNFEKADADLKEMIANLQKAAGEFEKAISENGESISALKTGLEKAVEDLKNSDRADKEYVLDSLGKAKAVLLALLESEKTEMNGKLTSINNTISYLQKKDAELEKKITDLRIYIDKELTRASKRAIETLGEKDIYYIFTPLMPNTSTRIVLKKPKTDSSIRKVWLPKTLAYILREWKKSQDELKGFLGDEYQDFDLVVALPNGRPCEDRIILKEFAKLREDAGLPKVVFHSLRHSSTTYKLKLNHGDLKATQGDTGHAEIDMITSIYAHILDEDRKVNAQKFETAFYAKPDLRNVRPPEEPAKSEPATLDLESLVEQLQKSPELASALAALIAAQAPAK